MLLGFQRSGLVSGSRVVPVRSCGSLPDEDGESGFLVKGFNLSCQNKETILLGFGLPYFIFKLFS